MKKPVLVVMAAGMGSRYGGMKQIDDAQIRFKMQADPYGLMNPGKTRGWRDDMARKDKTTQQGETA